MASSENPVPQIYEDRDSPPPTEKDIGIKFVPYKIGKKEWDELYIEVLYTIQHKLGANSSGFSVYAEDLYDYAQETFRMTPENHRRLFTIAREEKPPILVLNLIVVEAQELEAKDPNGFSDPYCMLGIQPGNPDARRNSSDDESGGKGSPRRQGLGKKLGASLKRRDRARSNSITDILPAKFIRTTTVKLHTLDPKWNEKFRLDIDDIHADRLHLDIWDHDDESSVFDAARKLNEISSLKGLGRYFKQIAQSARASTGESIDDFLGCVNIPLEDIPSSGIDKWFPLEGRTERSSVQGQIRLKLGLGTREDCGMTDDEDNWKEVVEHQQLLWIFIEHELSQLQGPTYEWAGDLPQPALTILHQHAIQGDVTEFQQTLSRWITYSRKHMEVPLDYALLYQLLDDLNRTWGDQENPLTRDEEAALAESFNLFVDYCLELIQKHRELFPPGNSQAQHKLVHLLKCLSLIHNIRAFKWCCPFRHELHVEITNSLKKGIQEWYNIVVADNQSMKKTDMNTLRSLIEIINSLNLDIQKGLTYYKEPFESIVEVNYSAVTYKQLEKMVGDNLSRSVQDMCAIITSNSGNAPSSQILTIGTALFELYMALQEFVRFRENLPIEERKYLTITNFHVWFSDAVQQWFAVAKLKAHQRIKKAVELDKIKFLDNYVKHSTSAVDTGTCFVQIKEFWRQLSWPDAAGSYKFVQKIIETICDGAVFYATLCHQKLGKDGLPPQSNNSNKQENITEQLCIIANNMEYVLELVRLLDQDLEVENIILALDLSQGGATANQCSATVYELVNQAEDKVSSKIFTIILGMAEKMRPDIKKFIFHLAWSPEKVDADSAIRPLLEYLNNNLKAMFDNLLQANFDKLLEVLWTIILQELTETASSNIGKERLAFFNRLYASLNILVDLFHGSGKGLPLECIHSATYQDLDHLLKLNKAETLHLIELYFLQRLEEQQKKKKTEFGYLTLRAFFNSASESLCIDVLNARELLPLDPTGFSDPFVIIQLVPKHFFPDCAKQRTKVQKKTLYPLFDESFEFTVLPESCQREGAALCFTVMDHDMMTRNDFEGEAFLPLCAIPGLNGEDVKDLKNIELVLMHPDGKDEILLTLDARVWDKDAQEFVKNQRNRR